MSERDMDLTERDGEMVRLADVLALVKKATEEVTRFGSYERMVFSGAIEAIRALPRTASTGGEERLRWYSPRETPEKHGSVARRVLVWLERIESEAPGRLSFGHRILPPRKNPHWPRDGWFFDGTQDDYRVAAWAYADPPAALAQPE